MNSYLFVLAFFLLDCAFGSPSSKYCCDEKKALSSWEGSWTIYPTSASWSVRTSIPVTTGTGSAISSRQERGKYKIKKKYKKLLLPLLLAYKLKFFTLIPVFIGGLVLLTGATGLAGFFFALFAAVMGLKTGHTGIGGRYLNSFS